MTWKRPKYLGHTAEPPFEFRVVKSKRSFGLPYFVQQGAWVVHTSTMTGRESRVFVVVDQREFRSRQEAEAWIAQFARKANPPRTKSDLSPYECIGGACDIYAERLNRARFHGRGKVVWIDDQPGSELLPVFVDHAVVLFRGKYYDYIDQQGVSDWRDLTLVQKILDGTIDEYIAKRGW